MPALDSGWFSSVVSGWAVVSSSAGMGIAGVVVSVRWALILAYCFFTLALVIRFCLILVTGNGLAGLRLGGGGEGHTLSSPRTIWQVFGSDAEAVSGLLGSLPAISACGFIAGPF